MEDVKPIKRSRELAPLSRDHHSGLLLCWKIRTGISKGISAERIADYTIHYYNNHLANHFIEEEAHLFPIVGNGDTMTDQAVKEHNDIVELITRLNESDNPDYETLIELSNVLEAHIRFEERQLFPYIEKKAETGKLENVGNTIAELHKHLKEPAWNDEFWVKTA